MRNTASSNPGSNVVTSALGEQLERVLTTFEQARRKPKRRSVHELRVAIRRLSAALELASALGHELRPRSRRMLRKLMALLSPLRDAQVQVQAVASVARSDATRRVLDQLRARQKTLRRATRRRLRALELTPLRKDVSSSLKALQHETPGGEAVTQVVIGELARRHVELERKRQLVATDDARALHRSRLALKGYRYLLEILAPLLPAHAESLRTSTAELQDRLGEAHDRHVLFERVRELSPDAPRKLEPELRAWQAELARESAAAQVAGAKALAHATLTFPLPLLTPQEGSKPRSSHPRRPVHRQRHSKRSP
jgi:CHAD domain-containing protein